METPFWGRRRGIKKAENDEAGNRKHFRKQSKVGYPLLFLPRSFLRCSVFLICLEGRGGGRDSSSWIFGSLFVCLFLSGGEGMEREFYCRRWCLEMSGNEWNNGKMNNTSCWIGKKGKMFEMEMVWDEWKFFFFFF